MKEDFKIAILFIFTFLSIYSKKLQLHNAIKFFIFLNKMINKSIILPKSCKHFRINLKEYWVFFELSILFLFY